MLLAIAQGIPGSIHLRFRFIYIYIYYINIYIYIILIYIYIPLSYLRMFAGYIPILLINHNKTFFFCGEIL